MSEKHMDIARELDARELNDNDLEQVSGGLVVIAKWSPSSSENLLPAVQKVGGIK